MGAQGRYSLQVAAELLLAAAGPVESMEGSLYQGCHDAAQPNLVTAAVALTIMLHAQHMARLMSHHKCRGEAILMVQGAAADGVAHPSDGSIAWEETKGGSSRQA